MHAPTTAPNDKPPSASILVVDDDASTRSTLQQALMDEGFDVETAANGDEAWEYIGDHTPKVVISDVRMRNGDGLSLLNKVRTSKAAQPIFFLMSGYSDVTLDQAVASGANGFFSKPCWLSDMLEAIDNALMA